MTDGNTEALEEEQTLGSLLEFLKRLEESSIKGKVIEEIKEKVEGYVKDDGKFSSTSNGYLLETIKQSKKLRSDILKQENTYRRYTSQFNQYNHDYAKHLINNVFPLFGCLYYMYYECAQQCHEIKGAQWYNEQCDGKSGGKDLNQWLKDEKDGKKHMISRGFKGIPLSQVTGTNLFPKSEPESLLDFSNGAQLQFALYYMLFLPTSDKWNDAQSGHAVLFLEAFCQKVKDAQFNGQYTASDEGQGFKNACESVKDNIKTLTELRTIVPVAHKSNVKYEQLLTPEHFWSYVKWLKDHLENLIKSLKEMLSDMNNWSQESLKTSKSFGPYPWGFTFRNNWEQKKDDIKQQLSQLTETLTSFSTALDEIKHIPSSSTASTVGGVAAGLGAAGAAGAAAYSGLLGPVADGIGKFFKGLFL